VLTIANERNLGFARACNQGLRAAEGEALLLLNNDTIVNRQALEGCCCYLNHQPAVGAVACRLLNSDGTIQQSVAPFPSLSDMASELLRRSHDGWYDTSSWQQPRPVDTAIGAFLMTKRSVLEEVGPLDERFFLNSEDVDWCRRVWDAGWQVHYLPEVNIIHLGSQSIRKAPLRSRFELYMNRVKYFGKHHGVRSALGASAIILMGLVLGLLSRPFSGLLQRRQGAQAQGAGR